MKEPSNVGSMLGFPIVWKLAKGLSFISGILLIELFKS